jgi:hypothetical protein
VESYTVLALGSVTADEFLGRRLNLSTEPAATALDQAAAEFNAAAQFWLDAAKSADSVRP